MGILKYICKHFRCTSNCAFNGDEHLENHMFDLHGVLQERFELKLKDMVKIRAILKKRRTKITLNGNDPIKSNRTPQSTYMSSSSETSEI